MFGHVDVHGDAALRATICGLIRSMAAVVLATVCCLVMYNRVTVAVVVVIHMRIMFSSHVIIIITRWLCRVTKDKFHKTGIAKVTKGPGLLNIIRINFL